MFAKILAIVAAIVFSVGIACKEIDDPGEEMTAAGVARGANVIPVPAPADTSARAYATLDLATFAYTYAVLVAPSGTIDSIALYQGSYGDPLAASAAAILCAGAAACAATSGTGRAVPPATRATIYSSIRAYGMQLVFFTTTAQKAAGGAMRGTMFPDPLD